ncbi:hypothetical protein F442_16829 [Phytophthora nicotianae P10297]|uniref:Uncharacterized protein n=1 Tax=Phytophthora nicotianae P10297 TaxID=1317064 RepID=W2YJE2_PHYNI|nr:hypothetical protein F442_16829 [Phytophthora nicotianae P10297]
MVKDGQHTANEEIKKATQTVYEASFKKFSDFCSTNGYPEPHHESRLRSTGRFGGIFAEYLSFQFHFATNS